jgi:hypothetical protein
LKVINFATNSVWYNFGLVRLVKIVSGIKRDKNNSPYVEYYANKHELFLVVLFSRQDDATRWTTMSGIIAQAIQILEKIVRFSERHKMD